MTQKKSLTTSLDCAKAAKGRSEERSKAAVASFLNWDRESADYQNMMALAKSGFPVNLQALALQPTVETLSKGVFRETAAKRDGHWGDAQVTTLRRVYQKSCLERLWSAGSLGDDLYAAGIWYVEKWQLSAMRSEVKVSSYEPVISGGSKDYGHLPRSLWQAQARNDYLTAHRLMPQNARSATDMLLIDDMSLAEISQRIRRRKAAVKSLIVAGLGTIYGSISHRIDVSELIGC